MTASKSFISILFSLISLCLGGLLIVIYQFTQFSFVDELILFLIFPVFYVAYRYPRIHYITMLMVCLGNFFFVSFCIQEPEPPTLLQVLSVLLFSVSISEIMHYLGISNRRTNEALQEIQAKNLELEQEIALRKKLEQEKNETQNRLKAIFEGAADAIFTKDTEFHYVTLNKSCHNLFGRLETEMVGKTDFDIFPPEFARYVREIDRRVLQGEIVRNEDRVTTCGRFFAFHLTKVPLVNEQGAIYGLCGIARDITEWKIAETALKESEERFRTIVETMQEGILLSDKNLDVAYANHNAERLFGHSLEETKHRPIENFFPADLKDFLFEKIQQRKKGISERYTVHLQRKDGSKHWLYFSSTPMLDQQGSFAGILSLVSDITDSKKMEEEREHLIADLQNALSSIRKLSGLLPICSACKKIRDDQGYWNQLEEYIHDHSEAEFTHSLCPDCIKKLYPQYSLPVE